MEAAQNEQIVETYWELLKNLDAGTRLALIVRLAQSLQGETSTSAGAFINAFQSSSSPANTAGDDTFWWDSLEG